MIAAAITDSEKLQFDWTALTIPESEDQRFDLSRIIEKILTKILEFQPPTIDCANPRCDSVFRFLRQPGRLPNIYFRCVNGIPLPLPCDIGTRFNFRRQRCVDPADWVNSC